MERRRGAARHGLTAIARETWIGVGTTALALGAMAVDHLLGDDAPVLEDPVTFAISAALSIALAVLVFRSVVPATKKAPATAPKRALLLSALAVVTVPLVFWLGLPFVLAGGGIALGLLAREAGKDWRALLAVALGALVIAVGTIGYGLQLVDKLVAVALAFTG